MPPFKVPFARARASPCGHQLVPVLCGATGVSFSTSCLRPFGWLGGRFPTRQTGLVSRGRGTARAPGLGGPGGARSQGRTRRLLVRVFGGHVTLPILRDGRSECPGNPPGLAVKWDSHSERRHGRGCL